MRPVLSALAGLALMTAGTMAEARLSELAVLTVRSGTVAPPYQWSYRVAFHETAIEVFYCAGSIGLSGPACASVIEAQTPELAAAYAAQINAAAASLAAAPLRENPMPPVGGGSAMAVFYLQGEAIHVPAFPLAEDADRAGEALQLLLGLAPAGMIEQAQADAEAKAGDMSE